MITFVKTYKDPLSNNIREIQYTKVKQPYLKVMHFMY